MKKKERRKLALKMLATRILARTIVVCLLVSGIYQVNKFLTMRVVKPLFELGQIHDGIRYYKEQEAKMNGYTDTTRYSREIIKLSQERDQDFYHSDDKVIAWISNCSAIFKIFLFLGGLVFVLGTSYLTVYFCYIWYRDAIRRFRKSWRRINTHKSKQYYQTN